MDKTEEFVRAFMFGVVAMFVLGITLLLPWAQKYATKVACESTCKKENMEPLSSDMDKNQCFCLDSVGDITNEWK